MSNDLIENYKDQLLKAIEHLRFSYNKVLKLPVTIHTLSTEELEVWEAFTARFARVGDLFLAKYIRAAIWLTDPGFRGSLRDFIEQAEKLGIIDSSERWMEIRKLRNVTAHEYLDPDLSQDFEQMRCLTPYLLDLTEQIKKQHVAKK